MLKFLFKKTFIDIVDNLLDIILINVGMMILMLIFFVVPSLFQLSSLGLFICHILGMVIINFYSSAVFRYTLNFSDNKQNGIKIFLKYIKESWKQSLVNSLMIIILLTIIFYVIPFYFIKATMVHIVFGTLVFWIGFTILMARLYYYPVSFRLKKNIIKSIQTCLFLFFNNIGFTIFMALISFLILMLSLIFFFLFPGLSVFALWINICLKIRLYKYKYLAANKNSTKRKKIPWNELISNDLEIIGKRTLKGIVFPWKS
jgi:hypothetical protein